MTEPGMEGNPSLSCSAEIRCRSQAERYCRGTSAPAHCLNGSYTTFSDTAAGSWYVNTVIRAQTHEIANGCGIGGLGVNDSIIRRQPAAFFCRYAEYPGLDVSASADLSSYPDADEVSSRAEMELSCGRGTHHRPGQRQHQLPLSRLGCCKERDCHDLDAVPCEDCHGIKKLWGLFCRELQGCVAKCTFCGTSFFALNTRNTPIIWEK